MSTVAPELGTLTIRRGESASTLRVDRATWTWVDHAGGTELVFFLSAQFEVGEPVDDEGYAHPGAWMQVFVPLLADVPDPIAFNRGLEDSVHHIPRRADVPASMLFDYEFSTIVRFKFAIDHNKGSPGLVHLDCEGRTAGGPSGDPPPIRFAIACRFNWNGRVQLGDRTWAQANRDFVRISVANPTADEA